MGVNPVDLSYVYTLLGGQIYTFLRMADTYIKWRYTFGRVVLEQIAYTSKSVEIHFLFPQCI